MNIHDSMTKILESEDILGNLFYETFLEKSPEVQEFFIGINMVHQAAMMISALVLIERYEALGSGAAEQYLRVLGARHEERQIPRELYPQWVEAMLETMARFHGDDWSEKLSQEWRDALEAGAKLMLEGYQAPTGQPPVG